MDKAAQGMLGKGSSEPLRASDVAVITGYSAQKELLKHEIARSSWRGHPARSVRVDTVDGFQGMERDLVLVSTVRSNRHGEVGFLRDARRANVLLTRARRGLIIFGNRLTLIKEEEVWGPWLRWIESCKALVSATFV